MQTYEPRGNEWIGGTVNHMVNMANESGEMVTATFRDIVLVANPGDLVDTIVQFYHRERKQRDDEWNNSPAGQESMRRIEEAKKRAADARAEGILVFSLADTNAWEEFVAENWDDYNSGIVYYAARWANLMEAEMAKGAKLVDIAEKMSHEANVQNISGFVHVTAVLILSAVWIHGEELRHWHDLSH